MRTDIVNKLADINSELKKLFLSFLLIIGTKFAAQDRVVLIEQFTNSSCPPCAAISPSIYSFGDNNPSTVAIIAYHTLFPYSNDSMYYENPVEATQRVNYYNISGVPSSVLDGNIYNGSTNQFHNNISTWVPNRLTISPKYKIFGQTIVLSGNQLSGSLDFTSLASQNISDSLIAHIVIIEKKVLKSSYVSSPSTNSETEYGYVMRKMIPNSQGSLLLNRSLNGKDNISFNWTLNHIKNSKELGIVAFVQNKTTREVYQTQLFLLSQLPVGLNNDVNANEEIVIYPNPSTGTFTIWISPNQKLKCLSIVNQFGETVTFEEFDSYNDKVEKQTDLVPGIYYVRLITNFGVKTQKLIIKE